MDKEITANEEPKVHKGTLRVFADKLTDAGKYALFLALVLIGIWCVGRCFEALSHSTVFEANLVYWIALSIWILLGAFVVGSAILYSQLLSKHWKERNVIAGWAFFGVLIAAVVYVCEGYRVASMNLFAIMAGQTESAQQALFQLFKFFSATPMLPVNLLATETVGAGLEINFLMPFVWSPSCVFIFLVWSIVYGALLLRMPGEKTLNNVKMIHLVLSVAGLIIMMALKSMSTFTKEQLIIFHAGVIVLLVLQVLLTYSSLRFAIGVKSGDEDVGNARPLPPSAMKLVLFLLIILPILADLQNQFALSANSRSIIKELAYDKSKAKGQAQCVTASRISVHSGPAVGDEVIGVLPKGTFIRVLENKHGWARIGETKWVSSKFLSPAKMR